jgi:hypothetical protein
MTVLIGDDVSCEEVVLGVKGLRGGEGCEDWQELEELV